LDFDDRFLWLAHGFRPKGFLNPSNSSEFALFRAGFFQQPLLAAVLLCHLFDLLPDGCDFALQLLDGGLFGGEAAGDDQPSSFDLFFLSSMMGQSRAASRQPSLTIM
jgi:hypothetical protein